MSQGVGQVHHDADGHLSLSGPWWRELDGSSNGGLGLLAIQSPDAAAGPSKLYSRQLAVVFLHTT